MSKAAQNAKNEEVSLKNPQKLLAFKDHCTVGLDSAATKADCHDEKNGHSGQS